MALRKSVNRKKSLIDSVPKIKQTLRKKARRHETRSEVIVVSKTLQRYYYNITVGHTCSQQRSNKASPTYFLAVAIPHAITSASASAEWTACTRKRVDRRKMCHRRWRLLLANGSRLVSGCCWCCVECRDYMVGANSRWRGGDWSSAPRAEFEFSFHHRRSARSANCYDIGHSAPVLSPDSKKKKISGRNKNCFMQSNLDTNKDEKNSNSSR